MVAEPGKNEWVFADAPSGRFGDFRCIAIVLIAMGLVPEVHGMQQMSARTSMN